MPISTTCKGWAAVVISLSVILTLGNIYRGSSKLTINENVRRSSSQNDVDDSYQADTVINTGNEKKSPTVASKIVLSEAVIQKDDKPEGVIQKNVKLEAVIQKDDKPEAIIQSLPEANKPREPVQNVGQTKGFPRGGVSSISAGISQTEPQLIQSVREAGFLVPPSQLPYNLKEERNPSMGQGQLMELLFKGVSDYLNIKTIFCLLMVK